MRRSVFIFVIRRKIYNVLYVTRETATKQYYNVLVKTLEPPPTVAAKRVNNFFVFRIVIIYYRLV